MLKIAEALQFINNNNIFHSDIKPENIVIKKIEEAGRHKYTVKFIDFGISVINYNNNMYLLKKNTTPNSNLDSYDSSDELSINYGKGSLNLDLMAKAHIILIDISSVMIVLVVTKI